jgi:hypothetical protein
MDEVIMVIRQAIAEQHGLELYAVVLIKPGTLLKTSSGKVQRQGTRAAYLGSTLDHVYAWELQLETRAGTSPAHICQEPRHKCTELEL